MGFTIASEVITIGDTTYQTDPETGQWEITTDTVSPFTDPQEFVGAETSEIQDLVFTGEVTLDGTRTFHLKGMASPEAFGEGSGELQLEYWIGIEDSLIRQIAMEGELGGDTLFDGSTASTATITMTMVFSDFGKPVSIEAPEVAPTPTTTSEPTLAPDFTVPLYSGGPGEFTLSNYLGHPIVLNFWASWCPPCRTQFPLHQAIADKYEDDGLIMFGVGMQDTEENANAFMAEHNTTFPTGPGLSGQIAIDYKVVGMPTTVFTTRDGRIYNTWVGVIDEERLTTFVEELLEQ